MKKVDVAKTVQKWKASGKAQRVVDQKEIGSIIRVLEIACERGCYTGFNLSNPATKSLAVDDELGPTGILEAAANQLKVHRAVWETHLDQVKNNKKTFEMPVIAESKGKVRYFKFYFSIDGIQQVWAKDPSLIKKVFISYHEADPAPEVVYEM